MNLEDRANLAGQRTTEVITRTGVPKEVTFQRLWEIQKLLLDWNEEDLARQEEVPVEEP